MDYFAVIDTETNWNNEVMSIGVVIAEKDTFKKVDDLYFIFDPEYKIGGMFSMVLPVKGRAPKDLLFTRKIAMEKFKEAFEKYGVKDLYAYRQYNDKIPASIECCKTGKMKRNYGVEPMMQLLSGNCRYTEVHNALYDADDELEIMRLLGKTFEEYIVAKI